MQLTETQIIQRKPVWIAFSDLFLDTDVSLSYDYITRICAESSYTTDELEVILSNEVAPVVAGNLCSVAGEWAGFDETWLVNAICQRLNKQTALWTLLMQWLTNLRLKGYINQHWQQLLPRINAARALNLTNFKHHS